MKLDVYAIAYVLYFKEINPQSDIFSLDVFVT